MSLPNKTDNYEKVKKAVEDLPSNTFINYDIIKITGLNYDQVKKFLNTMVDFEELKYSDTTKIYMRI